MSETVVIDTPEGIQRVRIMAIALGLEFYAKHKITVNTAYTPTNMMRAAKQLTGRKFRPQGYKEAADALRELLV